MKKNMQKRLQGVAIQITKKKMIKWHEDGFNVSSFRTPLNETKVSNIRFTKPTRTFICCPRFYFSLKISSDFALLISLGISSHNFGAREDILSVPK